MRQPTDLMVKILQSPRAQAMIDYVTNIYGESYVGLWLFEIEGKAVQTAYDIILDLRNQLSPLTATWALDYYEDEYGLTRGEDMSYEERRQRIKAQRNARRQANPKRICDAVSEVLGGIDVEMVENYDDNMFLIKTTESIDKSSYAAMDNVIDTMKPAHLIYYVLSHVEPDPIEVSLTRACASCLYASSVQLPESEYTVHAMSAGVDVMNAAALSFSSVALAELDLPGGADMTASIGNDIAVTPFSHSVVYLAERNT